LQDANRSLIGVEKEIPIDLAHLFEIGAGSCDPVTEVIDAAGNPQPTSYIKLDTSDPKNPKIIVSADMKNSDYILASPNAKQWSYWN